MSTFTDPLEPGSFEHNGQHPEVDEEDAIEYPADEQARHPEIGESGSTDATDEPDSFDENLEEKFKEFVGDAEPAEGPAPAG
ncbi:hypothetical protein [Herbiconiux daphne]|uniref:Uncharacterized protein n=1 Tax=Herbiconiux daphne TaxID=2970914 RepID=A0ABT2GWN0_9MICO|nr:hypothetical protein [Herbiconiux daphne]MCS5732365.1 hypothetical protein [Herbiconiux daphne]